MLLKNPEYLTAPLLVGLVGRRDRSVSLYSWSSPFCLMFCLSFSSTCTRIDSPHLRSSANASYPQWQIVAAHLHALTLQSSYQPFPWNVVISPLLFFFYLSNLFSFLRSLFLRKLFSFHWLNKLFVEQHFQQLMRMCSPQFPNFLFNLLGYLLPPKLPDIPVSFLPLDCLTCPALPYRTLILGKVWERCTYKECSSALLPEDSKHFLMVSLISSASEHRSTSSDGILLAKTQTSIDSPHSLLGRLEDSSTRFSLHCWYSLLPMLDHPFAAANSFEWKRFSQKQVPENVFLRYLR